MGSTPTGAHGGEYLADLDTFFRDRARAVPACGGNPASYWPARDSASLMYWAVSLMRRSVCLLHRLS